MVRGFTGNGALPTLGSIMYNATNCASVTGWFGTLSGYVTAGFYQIDNSNPGTLSPKKWIEVGANGLVIGEGTC